MFHKFGPHLSPYPKQINKLLPKLKFLDVYVPLIGDLNKEISLKTKLNFIKPKTSIFFPHHYGYISQTP